MCLERGPAPGNSVEPAGRRRRDSFVGNSAASIAPEQPAPQIPAICKLLQSGHLRQGQTAQAINAPATDTAMELREFVLFLQHLQFWGLWKRIDKVIS